MGIVVFFSRPASMEMVQEFFRDYFKYRVRYEEADIEGDHESRLKADTAIKVFIALFQGRHEF